MTPIRHYKGNDVDMLTACSTIAGSFAANITELETVRTDWSASYATDLSARIVNITTTYLGLDSRKDQRQATANLVSLQAPAKRDLTFFKAQIDTDFKKEPARHDEILRVLGFASYYKDAIKDKQEPMAQLLYAFKTNMTDALKTEISGKGLSIELINRIMTYADGFMAANVSQEQAKGNSQELKAGAIEAFNAIYDEVIAICKIAASYYRYEPLKKALFSFAKVQASQGTGRRGTITEPTPQPV